MSLKTNEIKDLSAKEAEAKIFELEKAMLEAAGEGKMDVLKSMKLSIARIRMHIAKQSKTSVSAKAKK